LCGRTPFMRRKISHPHRPLGLKQIFEKEM
jgi:hypothetical protein